MNTRIDTQHRVNVAEGRVATLAGRLGSAFKGWRTARARARTRRQSIRELRALSDKELKDIGLHRSQIRSVVDSLLARQAKAEGAAAGSADATVSYGSHCHA